MVNRWPEWIDAVQTAGIIVSTLVLAYVANLLRVAARDLSRNMRAVLDRQVDIERRLEKLEAEAHSRFHDNS
jgi:hypothetical protein